eukprot:Gb_14662 [translate_table: standard]
MNLSSKWKRKAKPARTVNTMEGSSHHLLYEKRKGRHMLQCPQKPSVLYKHIPLNGYVYLMWKTIELFSKHMGNGLVMNPREMPPTMHLLMHEHDVLNNSSIYFKKFVWVCFKQRARKKELKSMQSRRRPPLSSMCTLVAVSTKRLTQVLDAEREAPREFQPLPFHYVEMSRLLFDYARDDIPDIYLVRSLIEDIRDVRFHKVESGLETLNSRTHAVKLKNLSAMEVNLVRPFIVRALQTFYKHDTGEEAVLDGNSQPGTADRAPRVTCPPSSLEAAVFVKRPLHVRGTYNSIHLLRVRMSIDRKKIQAEKGPALVDEADSNHVPLGSSSGSISKREGK